MFFNLNFYFVVEFQVIYQTTIFISLLIVFFMGEVDGIERTKRQVLTH